MDPTTDVNDLLRPPGYQPVDYGTPDGSTYLRHSDELDTLRQIEFERQENTIVGISSADGNWWVHGWYPVKNIGDFQRNDDGIHQRHWRRRVAVWVPNARGTIRAFIADPEEYWCSHLGCTDEGEVRHTDDFERCVCERPDRDNHGFCSSCGGVHRPG